MKEVFSAMHSSYLSMAEIAQNKSGKIQNVHSESFFYRNTYRLLPKKASRQCHYLKDFLRAGTRNLKEVLKEITEH